MPAQGEQFAGRIYALANRLVRGLPALLEGGTNTTPFASCTFDVITGSTALPDLTIGTTAATSTLLSDADVPNRPALKIYLTAIQVVVATVASGGTAGTVSLTIQDSAGTAIATFTQTALSATGIISLPIATLPTGVLSTPLQTLAAATAAGKGIQAVLANSTAGVFRVRLVGYFAA